MQNISVEEELQRILALLEQACSRCIENTKCDAGDGVEEDSPDDSV